MIHGLGTTIVCACLAGGIGVGLFFVKHEVKEQEVRLAELNHEIQSNQEAIHVLKAEWSYLNDPARLRALSEKYLSMKVMGPTQVASLDSLPATGPVYAAHAAAAAVARADTDRPTPTVGGGTDAVVAHTAPAVPRPEPTRTPPKPEPTKTAATKLASAKPAGPSPVIPIPASNPAPVVAAPRVLYPGADTTPRAPSAQPRSIIVQSPALASAPAQPGEIR